MRVPWQAKLVPTALATAGISTLFVASASIGLNPLSALAYLERAATINGDFLAEYGLVVKLEEELDRWGPVISDFYEIYVTGLVLLLFAVFSGIGIGVASAAARKGRNFQTFFWLSLALSPLVMGIIAAVIAPLPNSPAANNLPGTKVCPKCGEGVKEQATVCRFCGYDFAGG